MSSAASSYLSQLTFSQVGEDELQNFVRLLDSEVDKEERQKALDQLLRMTVLTPEQAEQLARSRAVAGSVGLQLSLKRYARSLEYESAAKQANATPAWKTFLMLLASLFP